jgi:hypothetical protein
MFDVGWIRGQAQDAHARAEVADTAMRSARHRLLNRANQMDRAAEKSAVRRAGGTVPAAESDAAPLWTAWIAAGPDGRRR